MRQTRALEERVKSAALASASSAPTTLLRPDDGGVSAAAIWRDSFAPDHWLTLLENKWFLAVVVIGIPILFYLILRTKTSDSIE